MNDYVFAADGMYYHASQVRPDETGRPAPLPGAQPGKIATPNEFGEMPKVSESAAALLAAWAPQGAAEPAADVDKAGTYETKVDVPAAPTPGILTKTEAPAGGDGEPADHARGRKGGA